MSARPPICLTGDLHHMSLGTGNQLHCDITEIQTAHPMLVTQWQHGRKEIVWPPQVAEAQPLYPGPFWTE